MQKAFIKGSSVIDGNTAAITAVITHQPNALDTKQMLGSITNACNSKMTALAGSFNVLHKSATQTVVHGAVAATKDVLDYDPATCGFKSISSNMFMDDESAVWNLRHSEGKKVLVKSNFVDDVAEIGTLLQSCSSVNSKNIYGNDKELASHVSTVRSAQASIKAGAFVSVASGGRLVQGVVVAVAFDKDDAAGKLQVLPNNSNEPLLVSRSSVMHNETLTCGDIQGGFQSCSGSNSMERLLQYYGKLYEAHPEYFAQISERVRSYAFA